LKEFHALNFAGEIAAALSAPPEEIVHYIENGAIKVHQTTLPGFTPLMTVGADLQVIINAQVNYRFLGSTAELKFIQSERAEGRGNFFHILHELHSQATSGALGDKKVAALGLQKAYGHDMVRRPFMGSPMWMRRDMCIPFHHFVLQHILAEQVHSDLDAVFEVGAGIGDTIAELATRNPHKHIEFYGGDISLRGIDCIKEFADILGLPTLRGIDFDITKPDFGFLKGKKRILVFSQFALVYVNPFPEDFFPRLLDAVDEVTMLIFEPFSFALADEQPIQPIFSRERARAYGICENLWPCIRTLEKNGRIVIEEIIPDIIGKTTFSASSLVRFRKKK